MTVKKKAAKKDAEKTESKAAKKTTKKKEAPKKEALTEDYVTGIIDLMDEMKTDMEKSVKNASAARRARKFTTELAKLFKDFRKFSVEHHKR